MTTLVDKARAFFPFLPGGKTKPSHKMVMSLRPLRNVHAVWERTGEDGLVTITLTRSLVHRWDKLIAKVFKIPTDRKIDMSDELSSRVWELCDGEHTVGAIADEIGHHYQLGRRQAEISVLTFLNTLQAKKLVGLAPDHVKLKKAQSTAAGEQSNQGSKGYYARRKQRAR